MVGDGVSQSSLTQVIPPRAGWGCRTPSWQPSDSGDRPLWPQRPSLPPSSPPCQGSFVERCQTSAGSCSLSDHCSACRAAGASSNLAPPQVTLVNRPFFLSVAVSVAPCHHCVGLLWHQASSFPSRMEPRGRTWGGEDSARSLSPALLC